MSLKCGHNNSFPMPWSDGEECITCGEHTYETPAERVRRLEQRLARVKAEQATTRANDLEAQIRQLEGRDDEPGHGY